MEVGVKNKLISKQLQKRKPQGFSGQRDQRMSKIWKNEFTHKAWANATQKESLESSMYNSYNTLKYTLVKERRQDYMVESKNDNFKLPLERITLKLNPTQKYYNS